MKEGYRTIDIMSEGKTQVGTEKMGDLIAEIYTNRNVNKVTGGKEYMRSDTVKKGMQQAPHRSLFNALGITQEEMERPLVGIVSSYNEIVPGHMNLDKIVQMR